MRLVVYGRKEVFIQKTLAQKYVYFFIKLDLGYGAEGDNGFRVKLTSDKTINMVDNICNSLDYVLLEEKSLKNPQLNINDCMLMPSNPPKTMKEYMSVDNPLLKPGWYERELLKFDDAVKILEWY